MLSSNPIRINESLMHALVVAFLSQISPLLLYVFQLVQQVHVVLINLIVSLILVECKGPPFLIVQAPHLVLSPPIAIMEILGFIPHLLVSQVLYFLHFNSLSPNLFTLLNI